jgi:hypothetical protein
MSCFNIVAMNSTIYTVKCKFAIHATCSLTLVAYEYNKLQVSSTTQKLNCKANCKTPSYFIVLHQQTSNFLHKCVKMAWSTKGFRSLPLSILHSFYEQKVSMAF